MFRAVVYNGRTCSESLIYDLLLARSTRSYLEAIMSVRGPLDLVVFMICVLLLIYMWTSDQFQIRKFPKLR